jgi:hypothetical protein
MISSPVPRAPAEAEADDDNIEAARACDSPMLSDPGRQPSPMNSTSQTGAHLVIPELLPDTDLDTSFVPSSGIMDFEPDFHLPDEFPPADTHSRINF